jgi:hypothetical protein
MRNKIVIAWFCTCFSFASLYAEKVRILTIGNSFSEDAVENYLHDIAKADEDTLIIGNMYIGGCSLETHYNNATTNAAVYSYRKINDEGIRTVTENKQLSEAITDEAWDYISFQQVSQNSGTYNTYFPHLANLLNYVKPLATNPQVKYVLHQTWAYAQTSTHSGFANYNNNQATMYAAIVNTVSIVADSVDIDIIIPAGTAIQNVRTSYIGDNLCRDGYHLDTGIGRYTVACTWYEKLVGKPVMENTFVPEGLSSRKVELARTAAHYAVLSPQSVTDMSDFYIIPNAGTFILTNPVNINFGKKQAAIPWNNMSGFEQGVSIVALLDTLGEETPLTIEITDAFCGINYNGPAEGLTSEEWKLPPEVTSESFFGNAGDIWSSRIELTAGFLISNLNKDEIYDFTLLGARINSSDNREAYYTVKGATKETVYANNSNNTELTAIRGIAPRPDGTITIEMGAGAYNTNVNKFYYINALQISKSSSSPSGTTDPVLKNPININFGNRRGVENTWNNFYGFEQNNYIQGVVDTDGERTPLRIEIIDAFGGVNTAGPAGAITIDKWTLPGEVTLQSFFGNVIMFNNRIEETGGFLISNLNKNQTYDFLMFGSRANAADNRETCFTVEGATKETVCVNTSNNTSALAGIKNILPKPDGTIQIELTAGQNNNNTNKFFYINALRILPNEIVTQAPAQKFYIDFGQDNPDAGRHITDVDNNGNHWNNVIAPNGSPSTLNPTSINLKNSENAPTTYALEVARTISSNGGSNGGLTTPDPALLGDLAVASATEDYFFLDNGKGLLKFKNLDTAKAYRFHIYGCRTASGTQRGIIYSLSGKNGSHGKQLNTGTGIGENGYDGNNNNVWISTPVIPAANGEITLELGRLFSGQMAYISALKMEEYSGFTLPEAEKKFYIDFGKNNNGLDGAPTPSPDANGNYWNNMYSDGDGPTSTIHNPTFNLVTAGNDTTGYTLQQTGNPQWNGVRNGALGGTESPNEPTAALLGDLAIKTATYDYLFLDGAQTAILNFKNLNPAKQYRFNIFGSRTDAGNEGRVGRIEIAGANTITGIHQMGGASIGANGENYNNKNIFISDPSTPGADGKITLTLTTWLGFAHINCIKLEELDGEELPQATAIHISGGNNITTCGSTLQLSAAASPQNALLPAITWSLDNENIARITGTGKLYPKTNGTLTINATATLEDGTTLADTKEITISGQNISDYSFTIMGSSVPWGQGAEPRNVNGYAWLWTDHLQNQAEHTWTTNNISIGGNTTTDVINRWDNDLLPSCSRYVYYGLSLGNEGIHERGETAYNSWRDNMLALIEHTRNHGKIPVIGNNYPRGDFNPTDYTYVKQLNLLIHEWDAPSINLLGAIDNGAGQWATSYIADNAHPNTAGHAEMFYTIVPSLLDAMAAGKQQPQRDKNTSLTLEKNDKIKRIAITPEGLMHSFTLSFTFKTTATGTIASLITADGDTARLVLSDDGKLAYKTQTSADALNDGNWHTATLTHYYARGKTQLYIDGTSIPRTQQTAEKLAPVKFFLNDLDQAPQHIDFRELFLYRAGMCDEEIAALPGDKMLKSSLEIYAPLDGSADTQQEILENRAQSLNSLTLIEDENKEPGLFIKSISPEKNANIQLFNLQGIEIKNIKTKESGRLKIDISELPAGLYMLRNGGKTIKIIQMHK